MAIITEPSNLDVVVAHAGAITFRLTVPGRAAHASQRREGVSALDKLFLLTRALDEDERRRNEAETDPLMTALGLPYPTIIGIVEGGEWASTVLDRVVAYGRYGVRLGQSPAAAEAELRATIAEACAADAFLREHPRASRSRAGASGRRACRRTIHCRRAGGCGRTGDRSPAGTARRAIWRRHADVREPRPDPLRDLRPGDVRVAHSADEYVPLEEVETCAHVLVEWVRSEIGG
jgi:acetylornithine deacetylase